MDPCQPVRRKAIHAQVQIMNMEITLATSELRLHGDPYQFVQIETFCRIMEHMVSASLFIAYTWLSHDDNLQYVHHKISMHVCAHNTHHTPDTHTHTHTLQWL